MYLVESVSAPGQAPDSEKLGGFLLSLDLEELGLVDPPPYAALEAEEIHEETYVP